MPSGANGFARFRPEMVADILSSAASSRIAGRSSARRRSGTCSTGWRSSLGDDLVAVRGWPSGFHEA